MHHPASACACVGEHGDMRLVTLNTWGMRATGTVGWTGSAPAFRALQADVVTFQETILTERVDQAFEMLGAGYHLAQQQRRHLGRQPPPGPSARS
jgi:hypothetical protein